MDNKDVSQILNEIALLLELSGENPFKIRAYAEGARIIESLDLPVSELVRSQSLARIKGIGTTLSRQITQLVQEGSTPLYEELKAAFPEGVREMLRIPGLGPKKVKELFDKLGIRSIGELEYACHENRLLSLPGFGRKSQEKILQGIEQIKKFQGRFLFGGVYPLALALLEELRNHSQILQAALAGSLRRRKETVKDLDLVAESRHPEDLMAFFTTLPLVNQIVSQGPTKSSVLLKSGVQADLRVVGPGQFPYALHHFTGSKEHHTALRQRAKGQGYKLNEYGLFKGDRLVSCQDEAEIYQTLGMPFIPPELRENRGEIEAAENRSLPVLVVEKDLQGAFHFHTQASDGTPTLAQWVQAAREKGLTYLGISDHSQSAAYAGGLKSDQLEKQWAEIASLNQKQNQVHLFWGIESDILPDGSLDYSPDELARFDFVIASVHSRFSMTEADMTRRIIRAIENPYTTMLGHPTGRLLLARDPYPIDMDQVLEAAARNGVIIELNASPHRLDLDWRLMKKARQLGIKIAINPDAHHLDGLDDISYGVGIARKGWLTREDVFNCLEVDQIQSYFNHRKNTSFRPPGNSLTV
ncbi:MAG: DNA polymerase/3'-5' exonuclease PolX [Desulfobacca sp.]|nr:DNA polymerase/3'-5' exonuclease PolX [Desulfobacca sp.]